MYCYYPSHKIQWNILIFLGGATLLVITSPKLTGIVFLFVPAVVAPIVLIGRVVRRRSRDAQDEIAAVSGYAEETLGAIRTVQAFTHEAVDQDRFADTVGNALSAAIARIRARAALTARAAVSAISRDVATTRATGCP